MTRHHPDVDTPKAANHEKTPGRVTVSSEAERRAHVSKWIARHHKTAAATLGTAMLFLPAVAGAQTAGQGLVTAAAIDGVQDVQLLDDGSARITLENGRVLNVSAGDVVVGASGEVQVSVEVADIVAEAAAGAAAGGGGMGGAIAAGAAAGVAGIAAVAGGGGDGSDGGDSGAAPVVFNSSDVAGLRTFADVFGREPAPESERVTITVGEGGDPIVLTDPENRDTDGNWTLPEDFAENFDDQEGEVTVSFTAERAVPDGDGPVTGGEENLDLQAFGAAQAPEFEQVDSGSITLLVDTVAPTIAIDPDIAGDGVLNIAEQGEDLIITGTTDAEDGQEITVTVAGETYTSTASGGTWSVNIPSGDLAALSDADTVTVEATVEDAAGNPADHPAIATFETDFSAPTITIDDVSGDNQIGLADVQGDLEVTGTTNAEVGQEVTLTFNGQEFTGPVTAGGPGGQIWSVTVPQSAVQAVLTGAGEDGLAQVNVSATVEDEAGNPAEQPATATVDADFNGPSISINPISVDNIINADERTGDVTISGTTNNVGAGQDVTVTVDGSTLPAVQTDTNGDWSVTLLAADAAGLGDGASVTVSADVADSEGVDATQATATLSTDFIAPTIDIDSPIAGDDVLNIAEQDGGFGITGTSDVADGQEVTVTLSGTVGTPVTATGTVQGGAWTANFTPAQADDLSGWPTVDVAATVEDTAGNEGQALESFATDFVAPTIIVDDLSGLTAGQELKAADLVDGSGDPLTSLAVNGTSDAEGRDVTVTIGTLTGTATVASGSWSVDFDATDLGNELSGETAFAVDASVADEAGNTGTDSLDLDVDLTLPEITIDAPGDGAVLGLDAFEDGLDVSGTTTGVPDGQQVSIEIVDGTDTVVATITAPVAGDAWSGSFDAGAIAGLNDEAGFTLSARVSDGSFPVDATADIALSTDFAPELTIGEIGDEGVLILADIDPTNVSVSGTTSGVEAGETVTVTIRDEAGSSIFTNSTATVQSDGTWTLDLPSATVGLLEAGQAYDVQADVSNAAGRDAPQAQEHLVAYEAAPSYLVEDSANGTEVTMQIVLDPRTELPADGGLSIGETVTFDTAEITYLDTPAPTYANGFFGLTNDNNAASGEVVLGGIATSFDANADFLVEFTMDQQTTSGVIQLDVTSTEGGSYSSLLGTAVTDTIAANNVDTVIRGRGGDDTLDLSGAGVNTVQFEAAPADNGFDTVTDFSIGGPLPDRLGFAGLDNETLRGDGSTFEVLADGGTVGVNTGLIVFSTALTDLSDGSVQDAVDGLTGPADGDVLYFLGSDGSDAQLYEVQVQAGTDTVTEMARFEGLGDLSAMSDANILGFDTNPLPV